ncbi:hypothetical protein SGLAM104S_00381 [Streptomyces glaucescens]
MPVLIGLDDVQWADPLSRFALQHLPVRLRTSPVLWLLTSRREPAGPAEEIVAATAGHLPAVAVFPWGACPVRPSRSSRVTHSGQPSANGYGTCSTERAGTRSWRSRCSRDCGPPTSRTTACHRGSWWACAAGSDLRPGTLRFLQMGAVLGRTFGFHDAAALCTAGRRAHRGARGSRARRAPGRRR